MITKPKKHPTAPKALVVVLPDEPNAPSAAPLSEREMPAEMTLTAFKDIVQSVMSRAQFDVINGRTPAYAIKTRAGGSGAIFRYVPHGFVRKKLNEAFGFDYDFKILPYFGGQPYALLTREDMVRGGKETVQYITVLGELTIRLRDPKDIRKVLTTITKQDFGSQVWRASMEPGDALKAASSDALKRCGLGLGIALDLYFDDEAANAHWTRQQVQTMSVLALTRPTEPMDLLSRAVTELKMDASTIEDACHVSLEALMEMSPDQISTLWDTLQAHVQKPVT